jgi:hypothetical protein
VNALSECIAWNPEASPNLIAAASPVVPDSGSASSKVLKKLEGVCEELRVAASAAGKASMGKEAVWALLLVYRAHWAESLRVYEQFQQQQCRSAANSGRSSSSASIWEGAQEAGGKGGKGKRGGGNKKKDKRKGGASNQQQPTPVGAQHKASAAAAVSAATAEQQQLLASVVHMVLQSWSSCGDRCTSS